jgi:hypothetical protein
MNVDYLVDYEINDQPSIMEVRTELVPPIQSSAYRHTFRLPTTGFLDKNTLLLFKGVAKDGTVSTASPRFNTFNGSLGAVKRVQFQVGDFSIQDLSSVNIWATLNKLYVESPSRQNDYFGHYLHNSLRYKVLEANDRANFGKSAVTGSLVVDNDTSGINFGDASGTGAVNNSATLTNVADSNLLNAIPLGMLMPSLSGVMLPLFLFNEYRVHLIVEFESDSSKYANKISSGIAGNFAAASGDILFQNVELLVDQLIYPSQVQDSYLARTEQDGGYALDFMNVVNVKKTIPQATANATQSEEMSINVANQEVHYVEMVKQFQSLGVGGDNKVLLGQHSQSISIEGIQWNVNGIDIYPQPQHSPLSQYNQLNYILYRDIQVPKALYVADVNTQYGLATPVEQGLGGKYKTLGLSLTNGNPGVRFGGKMIGNYPIRCKYTRKPHAEIKATVDTVVDTITGLTEIGSLNVDFFVGMTRIVNVSKTPRGMSVVVVN